MPGLLDSIQATPRNRLLGLLADAFGAANDYTRRPDATMPGGMANPVLASLGGLLGLPDVAATVDRMSYGEPLTNAGKANVPYLRPETAGAAMAVAPAVAKYPKQAAGLLSMGMDGGLGADRAAIVFHGSPHKFDKFDASKIGTGEGAQAYGHGLYLAENPKVAGEYQKLNPTVEPPPVRTFKGRELDPGTPEYHAARLVDETSLTQARKQVAEWLQNSDPRMAKEAEGWKQTLELLNQAGSKSDFKRLKNTGNLYKVDLPDAAIARMLDWDKPLGQQAMDVQRTWIATKAKLPANAREDLGGDLSLMYGKGVKPQDFLNTWESFGQKAGGEAALRAAGIPGIRYLDGGSRGAGAGTNNYVIFPGEENILQILERNGAAIK